ncbi:MAG: PD40 domain-containing protein [Chitinophagaceae bacterium]|nr:PD40 domain-containing protein [Oligoflexus sp.]
MNQRFVPYGLSKGLWALFMALGLNPLALALVKAEALLPLKRMTVGPYDNFQATVDEAETYLYYTRSENLSSQVMRLNLKSGLTETITKGDADAKTPALSPDGKTLAITYFKDDAKGDICLIHGTDKDIECLTKHGVVDHSPVWLGNDRLAYISSDDSGRSSQLKVYDAHKKSVEVIYKGELYAPDLSPDGKTLVFKGRKNELVLYDLNARKIIRTLLVDLPGLTGPSRFSADGRYLYFAQYMLDSNKDLVIDGRDAAAIYRYDVSGTTTSQPVQITSLDQNCSFPYPSKNFLYMTCAFEGALDIYRGPLSGTVPKDWTFEDLTEAHQDARSYSDRILYLNHQHARLFKMTDDEYEQRLMQNFVLAGDYLPALYYMDKISVRNPKVQTWKAWQILLNSYARWEVLPQKKNLGAFAEFIRDERKSLSLLNPSPEVSLVDAYLDFFSNQFATGAAKVQKLQFQDDLSLFLQVRLAKLSLKGEYSIFLENRVLAVDATEENRMYFLSLWLSELPSGPDKVARIEALKPKVSASEIDLLDNELDLYHLVQSTDNQSMLKNYRAIVNRVKKDKDSYFSMRLLFNRAIIVLYQNKRSRDMADIVSLWLSYLKRTSKEFPYAVEAMRQNSLDLAYQFFHATTSDKNFTDGAFFDSIRISDDLESHFQYAVLNFEKWPELTKNYNQMIAQGLIKPESRTFVETVRKIVKPGQKLDANAYEEAAKDIEKIDDSHVGVGVKYLFLGYLYHRQLEFSLKGFKYDPDLAEKTHKAYLFAIDAALKNDRIQAAALQNLGVLHLEIRNYTLASEFLTQRHNIAYLSTEEELAVLWLKAKAMYLSYRSGDAYQTMKEALALKPTAPISILKPFQEKAAFYAWNAGDAEAANTLFSAMPPENLTPSIRLGYAHTLFALNRPMEALSQLKAVVAADSRTAKVQDAPAPSLVVQPLKLRFVALGLMAQGTGIPTEERIKALEERLSLYPKIIDNAKIFHFQKETLSDQAVKEWQDLANLYLASGQKEKARSSLNTSLERAGQHGEDFGYLNSTLINALKNAWINSQVLPADAKKTHELVDHVDKEFNAQKEFTALVTQKWAELKLIQSAFLDKNYPQGGDLVFRSKAVENLKADKPEIYTSLKTYREQVAQDAH